MTTEPWHIRVMNGAERGVAPALLRAGLAVAEPVYSTVVSIRNRGFDRDPRRARLLPRPVISIGNITAGGTGKTPVVRWLAEALRNRGHTVAILSRGYKSTPGTLGDEQRMLDSMLNQAGHPGPAVVLEADPDRHAAGLRAMRLNPQPDLFLLDDGFQHRQVARDLNIVLVNITEPFGFGHVLPRGLLREPLVGLARADAFILTHISDATTEEMDRVVAAVRRYNPSAPVYRCSHSPIGVRTAEGLVPIHRLAPSRAFIFSGIGNPAGFERAATCLCGSVAGTVRFPDHHQYTRAELLSLNRHACDARAEVLLTTEKDWVKIAPLLDDATASPIWRLEIAIAFQDEDGEGLLRQVNAALGQTQSRVAKPVI